MGKIVQTIAILLYPVCLVFGIYVVAHGHLTPGGGFQGGAVMATGAALVIVAGLFAHRTDPASGDEGNGFKVCEIIGLCLFALLAFGGLFRSHGAFFLNWLAGQGGWFGQPAQPGPNPGNMQTGGTIPWMNLAVGVEVLGGITIILLTMLRAMRAAHADWSEPTPLEAVEPEAEEGAPSHD